MKKRTKISLVLSSAAAILLAGSIMAGGTYALFTSESKTNIAVTSGKVDVTAVVDNLVTYSGKDLTGDVTADATRIYKTDSTELGGENGTFANGGTATYTDGTLTLDKMTPGDKVTFNIKITNNSNVAAKYRSVVKKASDTGLFNGLEIKVGEEKFFGPSLLSSYCDLGANGNVITIPVVVDFPSDRGNVYQDKTCDLTFSIEAVQGNAFTGNTYEVNSNNIQEYLDGQHGSLDGATLVLTNETGSTYSKLEFGRATKYAGSNTQYYIGGISSENEKTLDEFKGIKDSGTWSASSYYVRNINNLTLKAEEGVAINVAGLNALAGQQYGTSSATVYDYVLDNEITDTNNSYYLAQNWNNVTFEGINFTSTVNIASSQKETSIDGVTFKDCSFAINDITTATAQGIRFYNNKNVSTMKNLVVYNCSFTSCFQSIYTGSIYNIWVINSKFDTTKHNAIAVQNEASLDSPLSHGTVMIKNNTFDNIGNRFFRFGYVGSDTQIVVRNNKATNAKLTSDGMVEVVKAGNSGEPGALADGITFDIHGNDWGGTVKDETQGKFLDK